MTDLPTQSDVKQLTPVDTYLGLTLGEIEGILISRRLIKCKWNIDKTAKSLGIARATLYRKLNKYGLSRESV